MMAVWIVLGVVVFATLVSTVDQIRSFGILAFLSAPAISVLFAQTYRRYRAGSQAAGAGAVAMMLLLNPLTFGMAYEVLKQPATATGATQTQAQGQTAQGTSEAQALEAQAQAQGQANPDRCRSQEDLDVLARLPKGIVSASSNLGAHILMRTHHRALSAPYHRNIDGMVAQLQIALGTPDEAERLLTEHGVDYVAICRTDQEYTGKPVGHYGVLYDFDVRSPPEFLTLIATSPSEKFLVYRVTHR